MISTYGYLGIPDGVATAFVLIALSLMLTPWFGGLELGPLKVPTLKRGQSTILRAVMPVMFLISIAAFFPFWSSNVEDSESDLNELALRWLEDELGQSVWDGGQEWGEVVFQPSGREARYSNAPNRSGGAIEIQGGNFAGSGFLLFTGTWSQDDGREGEFEFVAGYGNEAQVRWGPDNSIISEWIRLGSEIMPSDEPELPVTRWASLEENAETYGPVFVDSLRVQASGTSGRTAHRIVELSAGEGRAFLPESLNFIEHSRSGGGRIEARFLEDRFEFVDVQIEVNGEVQTIALPNVVFISMYAETGSGAGNFNRGAWINGNVSASVVELPN